MQGDAERYGRVITALVTPLDSSGEVDYALAGRLAAELVGRGSRGIMVVGTTGESPTLRERERLALCESVRQAVDGRGFVWLGCGTNDTEASVTMTRQAKAAGADGVMAVVPYYSRPPQGGLVRHFVRIAEATELPVMVYNIPGRTACNLLPTTLRTIVEHCGNVTAVKEASRDLDQVSEIRRLLPPPFCIYSGDDSLTLPLLAVGADGVVSVASHLVPESLAELVAAFLAGDVVRARQIHLRLLPLFRALFVTTNPIPVKAALRLLGYPVGSVRPPLEDLGPAEAAILVQALGELGLQPGVGRL